MRFAFQVPPLSIWVAWTQSQQPPASLALQKIEDDLYAIALSKGVGGGNIAVYLTDDGVILVDDMFDRDYRAVMEQVRSLTGKPVKYVLNTHQHEDHAGGNAKMLAASRGIYEGLAFAGVSLFASAALVLVLPGKTRREFNRV